MSPRGPHWIRTWLNTFTQPDIAAFSATIDADYDLIELDEVHDDDIFEDVEALSEDCYHSQSASASVLRRQRQEATAPAPAKTNDDEQQDYASEAIQRKDAINYELCGRLPDNTFRDLRSAAKSRKRRRREQIKYYNWKRVKPDWLGAHVRDMCELSDQCFCLRQHSDNDEVFAVTKSMMFDEAKRYPRPPTYHRSSHKSHLRSWHSRIERAKEERKHAHLRFERDHHAELDYVRRFGIEGGPNDTDTPLGDCRVQHVRDEPEAVPCDAPKFAWTTSQPDYNSFGSKHEQHENQEVQHESGGVLKAVKQTLEYAAVHRRSRRGERSQSKYASLHFHHECEDWLYRTDIDDWISNVIWDPGEDETNTKWDWYANAIAPRSQFTVAW